jgi:chromosome segregation ATPase
VAGARRDWDESRAQAEADVDTEVEGLKAAYQAKLDVERDASLRFKGENGIMRKKFATLAKEIEDNREAIAASLARAAHLRGVVDALDRDILVLRGVIHDKDAVIAEREKRIYELKKKNQELEKFKFVLDVKIKDLKAQIEPREAEIAALKKQVREVNAELEAYHASNSTLDAAIGDLRRDIDALGARGLETRGRLNRKGAAVRDFAGDLHLAVQAASRPEDFARGLAGLVATYVTGRVAPAPTDLAVVEESERQRARLEGTLRALRARADAAAAAHAKGVAGLVAENTTLIEAGRS